MPFARMDCTKHTTQRRHHPASNPLRAPDLSCQAGCASSHMYHSQTDDFQRHIFDVVGAWLSSQPHSEAHAWWLLLLAHYGGESACHAVVSMPETVVLALTRVLLLLCCCLVQPER